MDRPRPPFLGRRRWPVVALLLGMLSLCGGTLATARPLAQSLAPAAETAQDGARIFLPIAASPRGPAPVGAPVVEAFQLSSASGPMAAEVDLRWRVSGATRLRIEPGVGDLLGGTSATVYPIATTTYTLTATNDKGSATASATYTVNALPSPDPLAVSAQPDAGRAAAANIGPAGGAVTATGADGTSYTLAVPPEALVHTEAITLTPVAAIEGVPFAAASLRAVSIAPEGLAFIAPATLTIAPPAAAAARAVGFAFQGAGAEFHLRRATPAPGLQAALAAGAGTQLAVTSAQSYGAAALDPDDDMLVPLTPNTPSNPADAVEHIAVTEDTNPAPGAFTIYDLWVRPLLQAAVADPGQADSAARRYIEWRALVRQDEAMFREEISEANLLLGEALRKGGALAAERCSQGRPTQGFALQRFMAYARRFGLVNTRAALEERLGKCWRFQATFQSHINEAGVDGYEYDYRLRASVGLVYDAAQGRMVGSAPLTWVSLSWSGSDGACEFTLRGDDALFDAAAGERGLSLAPVSRTSPAVQVRFAYDPGIPAEHTTITCPETAPITARTTAWQLYFSQLHAAERQGDAFVATTRATIDTAMPGWSYANTTTGPGGQIATEATTITMEHTPAE
jgi:hypothetical protein